MIQDPHSLQIIAYAAIQEKITHEIVQTKSFHLEFWKTNTLKSKEFFSLA